MTHPIPGTPPRGTGFIAAIAAASWHPEHVHMFPVQAGMRGMTAIGRDCLEHNIVRDLQGQLGPILPASMRDSVSSCCCEPSPWPESWLPRSSCCSRFGERGRALRILSQESAPRVPPRPMSGLMVTRRPVAIMPGRSSPPTSLRFGDTDSPVSSGVAMPR